MVSNDMEVEYFYQMLADHPEFPASDPATFKIHKHAEGGWWLELIHGQLRQFDVESGTVLRATFQNARRQRRRLRP